MGLSIVVIMSLATHWLLFVIWTKKDFINLFIKLYFLANALICTAVAVQRFGLLAYVGS